MSVTIETRYQGIVHCDHPKCRQKSRPSPHFTETSEPEAKRKARLNSFIEDWRKYGDKDYCPKHAKELTQGEIA